MKRAKVLLALVSMLPALGCFNRQSFGEYNATLTASPSTVPANGVTPMNVFLTVSSAAGPLTSGVKVFIRSSDANTMISQPTGLENGAYVATLRSRYSGTQTLTAVLVQDGTQVTVNASIEVTFNMVSGMEPAGVPDARTSLLVASPNTVSNDGTSSTLLTVQVRDSYDSPIVGAAVTFDSTGSNNTFSHASGVTDINGQLTTTMASTTAEIKTVTARLLSMAVFTDVAFSATIPSNVTSTLTGNPTSVAADGVGASSLTFTLRNAQGQPVAGQQVTWSSTGGNNTLVPGASQTDSNGVVTATLTSTTAETKNVTAAADANSAFASVSKSVSIAFVAPTPAVTASSFTVSPTTLTADGTTTTTLILTVKDSDGVPLPGQSVIFSSSGSNNVFSAAAGSTNSAGVFTSTLASTTAETKTVTATVDGVALNATATFTPGPPIAARSTLTVSPTTGTPANGSSTTLVTATLEDQYGNVVPSYALSFRADDTQAPAFALAGSTNANGVYTFSLSSSFAGPKTVQDFFNGQGNSAAVTFSQTPSYCASGSSFFKGAVPYILGNMSYPQVALAVDLNGDGNADLVFSDEASNSIDTALNQGDARFATPVPYNVHGSQPTFLATCDLNADGHPDIVTVNRNPSSISTFLGSTSGALMFSTNANATGSDLGQFNIACVDVTHDSKPDVIIAYVNGSGIMVFTGKGDGTVNAPVTSTQSFAPFSIAVGKLSTTTTEYAVATDAFGKVWVMASNGTGGWGAATSYGVGSGDVGVVLGDVNGDGLQDIVTANETNNTVSVLINKGSATFPTTGTSYAVGTFPIQVAIGDLNNDGRNDLVVSNYNSNNLSVLLNRGGGAFGAQTTYSAGYNQHNISLADFNRDGNLDLAVAVTSNGVNHGVILLGNGAGGFVEMPSYGTQSNPRGLAAGDVNGDGYPDLVVTNSNAPYYAGVYVNAGNGTFGSPTLYSVSAQPQSVSLVDINGDKHLDIITQLISAAGGLDVRLNQGNGTFGAEAVYPAGGSNYGMAWGDFNGDGVLDLASGNDATGNGNLISVLLGKASGGFNAPVPYTVGAVNSNPWDIATTDVNHDGHVDLIVALYTTGQFGVFLGAGDGTFGPATLVTPAGNSSDLTSVSVSDFNLDGYADVASLASSGGTVAFTVGGSGGTFAADTNYVVAGNPQFGATADFNGDGIPDLIETESSQATVMLFTGMGNGTFTHTAYPTGNTPWVPVAADFNRDGTMDFAVTNAADNTFGVYLFSGCP